MTHDRGGGNCTIAEDDECGVGFCDDDGSCVCVGRWTGEYCDLSFELSLGNSYYVALVIFLALSLIFLMCATCLLFLGRFQVRRRPLWVYYQHLSSVLLFFAAVGRTSYYCVNLVSFQHDVPSRTTVAMQCLFGVFFPLMVSITGLQLLIWAEIAKTSRRKRLGVMFHLFNFTLFIILVAALALLTQISDPRHLKVVGTIWRSYVVFILSVQFAAFCYCGFQAFRGCQPGSCYHPDPLLKQIATFTALIVILLVSLFIIWVFDTAARWDIHSYGPGMWLIFLYFYQFLEFFACLMLCFMMYSMFPPIVPSPFPPPDSQEGRRVPPMEWTENPTLDEVRWGTRSQSLGEGTPLNRNSRDLSSQRKSSSDTKHSWKDEEGNEMPFAWDVNDVNYSTYFLGRLATQDEEWTTTSEDPFATALENDFEDYFENSHISCDDSFRNYWAI